jgi:hypothetical protein
MDRRRSESERRTLAHYVSFYAQFGRNLSIQRATALIRPTSGIAAIGRKRARQFTSNSLSPHPSGWWLKPSFDFPETGP